MLFQWLCISFGSPQRGADYSFVQNFIFLFAQNPSEKQTFNSDHKNHEIWCAQNASQRSLFRVFIVFALDVFTIKEWALPRIVALTFFSCCRAGASTHSCFFNTSPARIAFLSASSAKVWSASRFFTSGIKSVIIIFASSNFNENHCRILSVFSRSRFSKSWRAKPTCEHHFFCNFQILTSPKHRFSHRDSHYVSQSALLCLFGDEKKCAPWPPEYEFSFFNTSRVPVVVVHKTTVSVTFGERQFCNFKKWDA